MQFLQLLWTVVEMWVVAFVSSDVMGDELDDIDTMFDWYHSIAWSGCSFGVLACSFNLLYFFFDLLK